MAWEALRLMAKLNLRPRRTVRVVFWTDEENESSGAAVYYQNRPEEIATTSWAFESDGGVFKCAAYFLICVFFSHLADTARVVLDLPAAPRRLRLWRPSVRSISLASRLATLRPAAAEWTLTRSASAVCLALRLTLSMASATTGPTLTFTITIRTPHFGPPPVTKGGI